MSGSHRVEDQELDEDEDDILKARINKDLVEFEQHPMLQT